MDAGVNVSLAENGLVALQMIKKEKFDIVLMDCQVSGSILNQTHNHLTSINAYCFIYYLVSISRGCRCLSWTVFKQPRGFEKWRSSNVRIKATLHESPLLHLRPLLRFHTRRDVSIVGWMDLSQSLCGRYAPLPVQELNI